MTVATMLRTAVRTRLIDENVNGGARIYQDIASRNATYPFIVINVVSVSETQPTTVDEIEAVLGVQVFGDVHSAVETVADAARTALHYADLGAVVGWSASWKHHWTRIENHISFTEITDNDKRVYRVGYDIRIHATGLTNN